MKVLKKEMQFCVSCMEEHEVWTIKEATKTLFKGVDVEFIGTYEYCERTEEMWSSEEMLNSNGKLLTETYKEQVSLLTSKEILEIRNTYGLSQKDLCLILGWGSNNIGRYESGKIQNESHNDILCFLRDNSRWLMGKLEEKKQEFLDSGKGKAYTKYYNAVADAVKEQNRKIFGERLKSEYLHTEEDNIYYGNVEFNPQKIVEIVNLLASKVNVHKVKLMKMLWYSDALYFKKTGKSITGIPYLAIEMGAAPKCFEILVHIDGIKYEVHQYYDANSEQYKFIENKEIETNLLIEEEINVINKVIVSVGHLSTREIVDKMHREIAFIETKPNDFISFEHAKKLSIS